MGRWILCILLSASAHAAGVQWSGAVRLGGGGAISGQPRGFDFALRLDALLGRGDQQHELEERWSAGPFLDLRTLDFARTDLGAGLSIATPPSPRVGFQGVLQLGGGYGAGNSPHPDAPQLLVNLFGGWRMPLARGHQAAVAGFYVDTRVLFATHRDVEITAGVVLDPIGIVLFLAERALAF